MRTAMAIAFAFALLFAASATPAEVKNKHAVTSAPKPTGGAKSEPVVGRRFAPGDTFKDCAECPEMVVIPPGSFMMGSPSGEAERNSDEGPQHRVTILRAFAVGKFEVTFAQWAACAAGGGCGGYGAEDRAWGRGTRPVINVRWQEAQNYVAWLSRKTGKSYRLLSEAEWEYAARAGTTTPFHFGNTISSQQANYNGNYTYGNGSRGQFRQKTTPVVQFPANRFGLHDMHGNVWEWVQDCYKDSHARAPSDRAAVENWHGACYHVVRGGSMIDKPRNVRSAVRYWGAASDRVISFGFRVARTLSP